jgi:hypothetical protein
MHVATVWRTLLGVRKYRLCWLRLQALQQLLSFYRNCWWPPEPCTLQSPVQVVPRFKIQSLADFFSLNFSY